MRNASLAGAIAAVSSAFLSISAFAQAPADAFHKGCGACHAERFVLRRIPKISELERRVWIEKFMSQHPCERDDLKPLIVQYLVEKSGR